MIVAVDEDYQDDYNRFFETNAVLAYDILVIIDETAEIVVDVVDEEHNNQQWLLQKSKF